MLKAIAVIRGSLILVLASIVMFAAGCDDSDGGDPIGGVTVQGNISDFDGGATTVLAGIKGGVTVKLKGTSYSATTADDGTFVISGILPGDYILVISNGDLEVEYPLGKIEDDSRLEISNITVRRNGQIIVEKVERVDLGTNERKTLVDDTEEAEEEVESADIAGKWGVTFTAKDTLLGGFKGDDAHPIGIGIGIPVISSFPMTLTQNGKILTGEIEMPHATLTLNGTIDGNNFELQTPPALKGGILIDTMIGSVNAAGTVLSGDYTDTRGDAGSNGTFEAVPFVDK